MYHLSNRKHFREHGNWILKTESDPERTWTRLYSRIKQHRATPYGCCLTNFCPYWSMSVVYKRTESILWVSEKLYRSPTYLYSFAWIVQFLIRNVQFGCHRGIVWMYSEQFLLIFIDSGRVGTVWRHSDENLKKLYNFSELYSFGLELYSFYCPAHQNSTSLRVEGFRKLYWPRLFNNSLWLMCCAPGVYKTSCKHFYTCPLSLFQATAKSTHNVMLP